MDQSVKLKLDEEETRVRELKEEEENAAVCRRLYSTFREYLTTEAVEGLGDFRIGGEVIRNSHFKICR
jgi:hypothetical protein